MPTGAANRGCNQDRNEKRHRFQHCISGCARAPNYGWHESAGSIAPHISIRDKVSMATSRGACRDLCLSALTHLCPPNIVIRMEVTTAVRESRRAFSQIQVAPSTSVVFCLGQPMSRWAAQDFDILEKPFDRVVWKKTPRQILSGEAFRQAELFPPQSCEPRQTQLARAETKALLPTSIPNAEASFCVNLLTHA
jgi:hypothetical protein